MGQITVFSTNGCRYCKQAKALLRKLEAPFVEINLAYHPERRKEMTELTNRNTVPQIFFNQKHIGGCDDLTTIYEAGELEEMVKTTLESPTPEDVIAPPGAVVPEKKENGGNGGPDAKWIENENSETNQWKKLVKFAEEMRSGESPLEVKNRRYRLLNYKACFIGSEAVDWLVEYNSTVSTREEATSIMKEMFKAEIIHHVADDQPFVDGNYFYRFQADKDLPTLNTENLYPHSIDDPNQLSAEVRQSILDLYNDFLSDDGTEVDYKGISKSSKFWDFVRTTEKLQKVDVRILTHNEKLAFWINIYNALVIHGRVVYGPAKSVFQRFGRFDSVKYKIGEYIYSLNDIENGILRSNTKGAGKLLRQFGSNDPRCAGMLSVKDPRIHFALVCGAKSCPPIKLYSSENIQEELDLAARAFLESELEIVDANEIWLSKIMSWYARDFGATDRNVVGWLLEYVNPEIKKQLKELLKEKSVTLKYFAYDWSSNSK